MTVTLRRIQEYYNEALDDALHKQISIKPFIYSLFGVMSTPTKPEDDLKNYFERRTEHEKLSFLASTMITFKGLIEYFPHEANVISTLEEFVEGAIRSEAPHTRKAAYLAIAQLAVDLKDKECLSRLIPYVAEGLRDRHPAVLNAALYALESYHYSEERWVILRNHFNDLFPSAFDCLELLCEPLRFATVGDEPKTPYYAKTLFETFLKWVSPLPEDRIVSLTPYFPKILEYLLLTLNSPDDPSACHYRDFVVVAINVVEEIANSLKEKMVLYVPCLVESVRSLLKKGPPFQSYNLLCTYESSLQYLLSTFEVLEKNLRDEDFEPLVIDGLHLYIASLEVMSTVESLKNTYKKLRKSQTYLKTDVKVIIEENVRLKTEELLKVSDLLFPRLIINGEEHIVDTEDRFTDESAYYIPLDFINKKQGACLAIASMAKYLWVDFSPFRQKSFDLLVTILDSHSSGLVRNAAVEALSYICVGLGDDASKKEELREKLAFFIPKCIELIVQVPNGDVVYAAIGALKRLLKKLKLNDDLKNYVQSIVAVIKQVLVFDTRCQGGRDVLLFHSSSFYPEDSFRSLVIKAAMQLIVSLGQILTPEEYSIVFQEILPLMLSHAEGDSIGKKSRLSFVIEYLSDSTGYLHGHCGKFNGQLLSVFAKNCPSENEELRRISVHAFCRYVENAKEGIHAHYPAIISILSDIAARTSEPQDKDELCEYIARIISSDPPAKHVDKLICTLFENLPLRCRYENYLDIFKCFKTLYDCKLSELMHEYRLAVILENASVALSNLKSPDAEGVREEVKKMVTTIKEDHPDIFEELTLQEREILEKQLVI